MKRREFCSAVLGAVSASSIGSMPTGKGLLAENLAADARACTLGYSTYGLPNLSAVDAVKLIDSLGYDSIEFTIFSDRSVAPEILSVEDRQTLVAALRKHGLRTTALMENLRPADSAERHVMDCARLERACELATSLQPEKPPMIQTVLGQRDWGEVRELCAKRMLDWLRIAEKHKVVVGIKPHRGHAMSRPSDAIWLLKKLGDPPWIRMVFDYSHFIFRDMPMEKVIEESLPYTSHIAVKDASDDNGQVNFKLPGESGTIDYAKLLKKFYDGGYRGDVCVEVSSQVWRQPKYDADQAAKLSYNHMSKAFSDAGIPRPK